VGFTRGWERGISLNGQKIKDFQSCLPILPSIKLLYWRCDYKSNYTRLNQINHQPGNFRTKQIKKKFTRGGVYTWVGKGYFSERAKN
jgi:hypothetical protein